jgi:2-polyprenyl-3-methyl-5-hydroxy-6-metoxy-1,4-benzoquinol methylase
MNASPSVGSSRSRPGRRNVEGPEDVCGAGSRRPSGGLPERFRSIVRDRLVVTDDGVHLRIGRLRKYLGGFLARHPGLLLREIELAKLLMGGEGGVPGARFARITGDLLRPSRPIGESPHARLLRAYLEEGDEALAPGRFEATAYYENAARCLEFFGRYFIATRNEAIVERARKFCRMVHDEPFREHGDHESAAGSPVVVRRIRHSDCYEIVDGHHRLSLASIKGDQTYRCLVEPSEPVLTPLQQMVLDSNWTTGERVIYQPISAPEVAGWPVVRRCEDRLGMMRDYLGKIGLNGGTYLDIGCSYGWFVSRMAADGYHALGFDRDEPAIALGRLAFRLPVSATRVGDLVDLLDAPRERPYDVVSCFSVLHHVVLDRMRITAAEFIRKVDAATGSVLFLDTGEAHEGWFSESLAGWNAEFIRDWLGRHTTFDEIEILGTDSDDVGPYRDQYRRHLFACRRRPDTR